MATTISTQDIVDAKRDIEDIGKAVNEKVIVSSRYGDDFKSLPMIADEAQVTIGEWESAIALITQEGGIPALAVSDASGLTQQKINDGLESIGEMLAINEPQDGVRVFVKSYHAGLNSGGGYFTYENSRASENDGGVVINGWVREVNNVAIMPAWFGVRTDGTDDPLNPNHELLQVAVDAGYKSFDFGGSNNKYLFNGQVGLKAQVFYNTNAYMFTASGALVTIEGSYSWLTTKKVKDNGGIRGVGLGFTGKLMVRGFSFTGGNTEGVFDGDHIYNVLFVDNDCYQLKALALSYVGRLAQYPKGYFQTVTIKNNHFASCHKILNGAAAFNINVSSNTFEGCRAGIYIFGDGQPCIATIRIKDNVFEGGGLFLKLGDASASTISGNYLEANEQFDAATEKCQILLTRSGGSYLANHDISNNMFAGTLTQNADTAYQAIKFVDYPSYSFRGTAITNNWSSTELTKSPVRNMIGNIAPKTSKTTGTAVDAKVEFVTASKALSVASNVTAGKLDVLWFDALLPNSTVRHDMQFTAKLSCIAKTAAGVELTRFFATFDFAIYSLLVGGGVSRQPENLGVSVGNFTVMQQPVDQVVDKVSGETIAQLLTSPEITVESSGNKHAFKISGFSAVASATFGAVTDVDVYAEITGFGGRGYNTVGSLVEYYK